MRNVPYPLLLLLLAIGVTAALAVGWQAKPHVDVAVRDVTPTGPDGHELFTREWLPNDPRSHGGDGLGPMFNDSSCVACHNLGGTGGAGPANKNVRISTSFHQTPNGMPMQTGPSVVQHLFSTDPDFQKSQLPRSDIRAQTIAVSGSGSGTLTLNNARTLTLSGNTTGTTARNTTALFGVGRIDAIPDEVLEAAAAVKNPTYPEVVGRVARMPDGRVGRFGWKAQQAKLDDFVLTACAVEIGLQVPGKDQPMLPHKPDYKAPGLDMNADECAALISFVRDLPVPRRETGGHRKQTAYLEAGERLFTAVGCATCHTPTLGSVNGIYSDLLLHDLGPALADSSSSYGLFVPQPKTPFVGPSPKTLEVVATATEWRTPPLWGVRDSGPYLHDGRAASLQGAIAFHGGQAKRSTELFTALPVDDQQKLIAFLKSLVAP